MKICENCGAESPDDANICLICGHELPNPSSQDFMPNNNSNNLDFNNMNNPSPNQNTQKSSNICNKCGRENPPHAKFCTACGLQMESNINLNQEQQQNQGQEFNNQQNQQQYQNNQQYQNQYDNQQNQYTNQQYQNQYDNQQNQYNNQQNQYNNQQYNNQMYYPKHPFYNPDKSVGLSIFLSFIIPALGQAYLGLYKRFAFEFLSLCLYGLIYAAIIDYLVPTDVISTTQSFVITALLVVYLAYYIYIIYDTYKCARAVRFDTDLPLFLDRWDIK